MSRSPEFRLLLSGGGTGGHLFPALALAQALEERFANSRVMFLGTGRRIDRGALADSAYEARVIHCKGLKGKGLMSRLSGLLLLPVALCEALWFLLRFRPHLVVGVGGYVTGPVLLAARLLGRPTVIHEQNSLPGLANRKLAPLVDRICLSLPAKASWSPENRTRLTGNPVRREILALAGRADQESRGLTLLVLGGSLGAHRVNQLMVAVMVELAPELRGNLRLIHQTGPADEHEVRNGYERLGMEAEVAGFIKDMARVYGQADLVVSRAGATSLAELAVLGLPAILIPYPHAADNHQVANGEIYVKGGGALLKEEGELDAVQLATLIQELLLDPSRRARMADAMTALARPGAAAAMADVCLELLPGPLKNQPTQD